MARNPTGESASARFAKLLSEHLARGTRPATKAGEPWKYAEFAREVESSRESGASNHVSARSPSNWCRGSAFPMEIEPILRALFGPAASQRYRQVDADALREAYVAARNEKNAAVIARAKPNPAGERWGTRDDQLVIDRSTRATDKNAALEPLHQQLQAAIARMAAELVEPAKRLLNSRTWRGLAGTAAAFRDVVDGDPQEMPERLGNAYALLLRLGRFLETDVRLQRDTAALDDPLDPDIHGLLTDVVRTAAPWLRGFPTVAAWDDAAGKALVRADLFQPAREFTRIAQAQQAISEMDAAEMEQLAEAADVSDYQGQKAGNRAVGSAQNLIIAAARVVSPSLLKTDISSNPLLVQRAGTTLTAAVDQVEAFAAALPVDVAQALRALVEEVLRRTSKPLPVEPSMDLPLPDDIEEQARAMILEGHAPPAAWCPFIHTLSFHGTTLDNLELLVGLTALQSLDVDLTPVCDVSPLAGLTALLSLDLGRTRVSDVSPLAGLTALQSLILSGTQVTDMSPLSHIRDLQIIAPFARVTVSEHPRSPP